MPIFQQKVDVRNCNVFKGVKPLGHAVKVVEKVLEKWIQELLNFDTA